MVQLIKNDDGLPRHSHATYSILVRERGSNFNKVLDFVDKKQGSSENGKLGRSFIDFFFLL